MIEFFYIFAKKITMNIHQFLSNDRLIRAVTGLPKSKFEEIVISFGEQFQIAKQKKLNWKGEPRQRPVGAGGKYTLKTDAQKVFFVLFYFKCYPTFDLLGFFFGIDRSNANRCLHEFAPILEAALGAKLALPERKIESIEAFTEKFGSIQQLIVDGTERPIQRPKNAEKQKSNYSGKKKRHTRKHIVGVEKKTRILILTSAEEGKKHDKTMAEQQNLPECIPGEIPVLGDLAFKGWENIWEDIKLPHKKPKKQDLSDEQKEENKKFSGLRVSIEHAIGGMKRYGAMTQIYRNRKENFDDKLALISAGLWNFYNQVA